METRVYRAKANQRTNLESIKTLLCLDMWGYPVNAPAGNVDLAHIFPSARTCKEFHINYSVFMCGLEHNQPISEYVAERLLHGFIIQNTTTLKFSFERQIWNYVRMPAQAMHWDFKPSVYIWPLMTWACQKIWDGVSGFYALVLANSSEVYLDIKACRTNISWLYWNRPDDRRLISLGLEGFADAFVDVVSIYCTSKEPSASAFKKQNKICTEVREAIRKWNTFELFDVTKVPPNAVFPMVRFKDNLAPHPAALQMKNCNSHVNIKYRQNRIFNFSCDEDPRVVAIVAPSCFDMDEEGGSCILCRDMVVNPNALEMDEYSELSADIEAEYISDDWNDLKDLHQVRVLNRILMKQGFILCSS